MKEFFHHLFLPRESNNHRPKLLHHNSLLFIIILLLVGELFLLQVQNHTTGILGITTNISIDELLTLTNQKRQESGLSPLRMSSELGVAARNKASDMFSKNYWAHNAPDGTPPWTFIKGAGYEYIYAGENLARGFSSAGDVVTAWMNSQGHKENLLSPNYTEIGFAIQTGTLMGEETALVVQEFGSRKIVQANPVVTTQANAVLPTIAPTQAPKAIVAVIPAIIPTAVPTVAQPIITPQIAVASVQNNPLINKKPFTRNIAVLLLLLFISVLILDMLLIERKKIVRFVGHNIDHIIFFIIILLIILIIGRGTIL